MQDRWLRVRRDRGAAEGFVFAFAAFKFLGSGSELGVEGFEMGFAFEAGLVVVA